MNAATKLSVGLQTLKSLGWLCPKCDGAVGPARTIPDAPSPDEILTCTIVCARRGHHIKGDALESAEVPS